MPVEKAKRKNDEQTKSIMTEALRNRIMSKLHYFLVAIILLLSSLALWLAVSLSVTLIDWVFFFAIVIVSTLVIYCMLYSASTLSAYLLIKHMNSSNTIMGIVISIIICTFMFYIPFPIPIAIVFTIYSVVRKKMGKAE